MGSALTVDKVKAGYKKWVLRLHPDKNMNNVANATRLFKRLNSGYEEWKGAPVVALLRPADDPPNCQFNPTTPQTSHPTSATPQVRQGK